MLIGKGASAGGVPFFFSSGNKKNGLKVPTKRTNVLSLP
jgi:hypothetical protein